MMIAHHKIGGPIRVIDFGGGAPIIPLLMKKTDLTQVLDHYLIAETQSYVKYVPKEWAEWCQYTDDCKSFECNLLVLSVSCPIFRRNFSRT